MWLSMRQTISFTGHADGYSRLANRVMGHVGQYWLGDRVDGILDRLQYHYFIYAVNYYQTLAKHGIFT